jgi:L-seryl-tRNA(Ser) seleniumtransferase
VPDLSKLPRVDKLSQAEALECFPPKVRLEAARAAIDRLRRSDDPDVNLAEPLAVEEAHKLTEASLKPVINASGVILHTGLGRARLAREAVQAIVAAASGHANLELDIRTGRRGDRQVHTSALLKALTGAEDALVVQNCAAALFLALRALGAGKEVLLSRGQMVEIGGALRLPDVVKQSGCKLVEVGTTNKTRLSDYEAALTPRTRVLLRCHPSNYAVVGFTEEPELSQLSAFAKVNGILLIDDVGSGCIVDTARFGLPKALTLQDSLRDGADIAMGSGDKLLGGPQAGILLGSSALIAKIGKNPVARAVRIDKLSLAGLEATLRLYRNGQEMSIPTLRYMGRKLDEIKLDAVQLQQAYGEGAILQDGITEIGGGTFPTEGLPTIRVGVKVGNAEALAEKLRTGSPPIITRIEGKHLWLDPRTLEPEEVALVAKALRDAR